jgi:hypothetical protein
MLHRANSNSKIKFKKNSHIIEWLGENGILSGAIVNNTITGIQEKVYFFIVEKIIYNSK